MFLSILSGISKGLFFLQALIFKLKKSTGNDVDEQFPQVAGLLLAITSFQPNIEANYKDEMARLKMMAISKILAGTLEKPVYAALHNAALV